MDSSMLRTEQRLCLEEDSNLHASQHEILSLACLPFHHQGDLTGHCTWPEWELTRIHRISIDPNQADISSSKPVHPL